MNVRASCPCCSESMLLHLSSRRSYWFCSHCRLEIPGSEAQPKGKGLVAVELSASLAAAIKPEVSETPAIAM